MEKGSKTSVQNNQPAKSAEQIFVHKTKGACTCSEGEGGRWGVLKTATKHVSSEVYFAIISDGLHPILYTVRLEK